jgi:glycosyltransferase involved in cell wall biosynthesis
MLIVQVNMFDALGGAEKVARDLHRAYLAGGHESWLAVGRKRTSDPRVVVMPNHFAARAWPRFWWRIHHHLQPYYGRAVGWRMLCRLVHALAEPEGVIDRWRGVEDINYPGTWRLLETTPQRPDVLHCHNLHQKYFDLRALPWLSRQVPVFLTMHDAWLLSGHCAHSFDCERWKIGCGQCPDLSIHPPIRRDATAFNWKRKRDIYAASRLHVATPCRWLMSRVEQSILAPGIVESRVIPYGVDLDVFCPGDKQAARAALDIPHDADVLLFAASGIRKNVWKDFETLRQTIGRLADRRAEKRLLFVALGESAPAEQIGRAEIRFVPFVEEQREVARYYAASDIYVHAARADTFPNAVLEALACGTPVVATAVGGIPEQVISLPLSQATGRDSATGVLLPVGDVAAMSAAVACLLDDDRLRGRLGDAAAADARRRFDLKRQVRDYIDWYSEVLGPVTR